MNKKSIELAMNTIVIAVIVLIVAFIIIFMFQKYYAKEICQKENTIWKEIYVQKM